MKLCRFSYHPVKIILKQVETRCSRVAPELVWFRRNRFLFNIRRIAQLLWNCMTSLFELIHKYLQLTETSTLKVYILKSSWKNPSRVPKLTLRWQPCFQFLYSIIFQQIFDTWDGLLLSAWWLGYCSCMVNVFRVLI